MGWVEANKAQWPSGTCTLSILYLRSQRRLRCDAEVEDRGVCVCQHGISPVGDEAVVTGW